MCIYNLLEHLIAFSNEYNIVLSKWAKAFLNEWIESRSCRSWIWYGFYSPKFHVNGWDHGLYFYYDFGGAVDWVTWRCGEIAIIRWVCVQFTLPLSTRDFSFNRVLSVFLFGLCVVQKKHIHQFQPKSLKPNHFKVGLGMFNCKPNVKMYTYTFSLRAYLQTYSRMHCT